MGYEDKPIEESAERRFRLLIDHCPDAICVHQDGRVVYVNTAAMRWMAAQSRDQLIGREITRFVDADSIPPMLARIASLRHEGDVSAPSEAVMLRFDGATLDVEAVSVLTTWDGAPAYQVIFRDLTAQKAAQITLRYQAALVDHVSDAIIATTAAGLVTSWNRAAEIIYHRPAEHALARPVSEAVGALLDPAKIVTTGGMVQATHRSMSGSYLNMRVSATAMDNGFVLLCSDQTAVRRAEQHFQTVVSSLEEGILVLDGSGQLKTANPAAGRILGVAPDVLMAGFYTDPRPFELYDADDRPLADSQIPVVETLTTGLPVSSRIVGLQRQDARRTWLSVNSCQLDPLDPTDMTVLVSFRDVTDQWSATKRLAYQAAHDPLTGLPNRVELGQRMAALQRDGSTPPAAVLYIDLDNFKSINDSLGHETGDAVIKVAAERLRVTVRELDTVGRLGGDEFVVLLVGDMSRADLDAVADRILEALAEPMSVAGNVVQISASIGIVETPPDDRRDIAEMLRQADKAMYTAKARGRHTSCYFDGSGQLNIDRRNPATPEAEICI